MPCFWCWEHFLLYWTVIWIKCFQVWLAMKHSLPQPSWDCSLPSLPQISSMITKQQNAVFAQKHPDLAGTPIIPKWKYIFQWQLKASGTSHMIQLPFKKYSRSTRQAKKMWLLCGQDDKLRLFSAKPSDLLHRCFITYNFQSKIIQTKIPSRTGLWGRNSGVSASKLS